MEAQSSGDAAAQTRQSPTPTHVAPCEALTMDDDKKRMLEICDKLSPKDRSKMLSICEE
jgi:hypothetical protein